ncbi:MAG: hypothetical protein F2799_01515 [Actinobacteria bacterium]|uniref:Unannotated protein n=1 Tax=freshwater metagenome TaxID=449393 RepID=A0A6J7D4D3_9ZZZZ|nr:hypothetical protein [Actinomycetota bacterium]
MKWVAGVVVLGVLLGGLFLLVSSSSLSAVKKVEIHGLSGDRASRVKAAALGQSTLSFDEGPLRYAAAGHPPVKTLTVKTHFPDSVEVSVALYRPVAAVGLDANSMQAVAGDGTVLPDVPTAGLPSIEGRVVGGVVRDRFVKQALMVLDQAGRSFRTRIDSLASDPKFGLYAVMTRGPKIYFGDSSDARAKWAAIAQVLSDIATRGATYVDVRVAHRPAVGGLKGGVQGGIDPSDPNQPVSQ